MKNPNTQIAPKLRIFSLCFRRNFQAAKDNFNKFGPEYKILINDLEIYQYTLSGKIALAGCPSFVGSPLSACRQLSSFLDATAWIQAKFEMQHVPIHQAYKPFLAHLPEVMVWDGFALASVRRQSVRPSS